MSAMQEPPGGSAKPWSQLTVEERRTLTSLEKAYARSLDLKLKSAAVDAHIARLEKLGREKARKRETRRKIVAGGVFLAWAAEVQPPYEMPETVEDRARFAQDLLDARLTRSDERALFDLPPRVAPAGAGGGTR